MSEQEKLSISLQQVKTQAGILRMEPNVSTGTLYEWIERVEQLEQRAELAEAQTHVAANLLAEILPLDYQGNLASCEDRASGWLVYFEQRARERLEAQDGNTG